MKDTIVKDIYGEKEREREKKDRDKMKKGENGGSGKSIGLNALCI